MNRPPKTADATSRRRRAALTRADRLGGSLAVLVRAHLATALEALPERPGHHDAEPVRRAVVHAVRRLAPLLAARLRHGLLQTAQREHLLTARQLTRAARGRSPVHEGLLDYLRLIIRPPPLWWLEALVGFAPPALTRLIDPDRASAAVLQGIAAGKDRRAIAADLTDAFGGYESAARRVARTEGLRAATQAQLHASESIPELVIGYEIDSVLDNRVRPEHAKRHGQRFYRHPRKGQRGLNEMPQPPLEADGRLAHNCRCYIRPLFGGDIDEPESQDV